MINFLEFSHNIDQISAMINDLRSKERSNDDIQKSIAAGNQLNMILGNVPPAYLDKLPDTARANLAWILANVLDHHSDRWDDLKQYLQYFWDQPIDLPGKSLGKELLNRMSAEAMDHVNAPFFISYSGNLSKYAANKYTKQLPKVVVSPKNYGYNNYSKLVRLIQSDYAENFNNSREKQKQIK